MVGGDEIEQQGGGDQCTLAEARVEEPGHDAIDSEVSPVLTTQPTGVDGDQATTCDTAETEAERVKTRGLLHAGHAGEGKHWGY